MPLIGTRGSLSARGFGMLNLGGGYWIATLGGTGYEYGSGISVDGAGNVYMAGYTNSAGAGADDILIAKYNTSGVIQWQRTLGSSTNNVAYDIDVDASGNVYIAGYTDNSGANTITAKYDPNGVIQWQKTLDSSGSDAAYGIGVDSTGNSYIAGYTDGAGAGGQDVLIAKYNTTGTLQWQKLLGGTGSDLGRNSAVDSSGNVYIVGITNSGGGGYDALIAKYNDSGVLQWQRTLGGAGAEELFGVAVDSTGSVYVTGYSQATISSPARILIAKYNTSGGIQWQRILNGATADSGSGIALDANNNVYVVGYTISTGRDILIAKYNTNGVIQWQRTLGGVQTDSGSEITLDFSGNMYITGYTASAGLSNDNVLIAKLPGDGSKTGTYGAFTYAASSLTDAAGTLTDAAGTLTDATASLTGATSSLTGTASSLTSTVIPV